MKIYLIIAESGAASSLFGFFPASEISLALRSRPVVSAMFSLGWNERLVTTDWCWLDELAFLSFLKEMLLGCRIRSFFVKMLVFDLRSLPIGSASESSEAVDNLRSSGYSALD